MSQNVAQSMANTASLSSGDFEVQLIGWLFCVLLHSAT